MAQPKAEIFPHDGLVRVAFAEHDGEPPFAIDFSIEAAVKLALGLIVTCRQIDPAAIDPAVQQIVREAQYQGDAKGGAPS